jgi:hypothetical protein
MWLRARSCPTPLLLTKTDEEPNGIKLTQVATYKQLIL